VLDTAANAERCFEVRNFAQIAAKTSATASDKALLTALWLGMSVAGPENEIADPVRWRSALKGGFYENQQNRFGLTTRSGRDVGQTRKYCQHWLISHAFQERITPSLRDIKDGMGRAAFLSDRRSDGNGGRVVEGRHRLNYHRSESARLVRRLWLPLSKSPRRLGLYRFRLARLSVSAALVTTRLRQKERAASSD